MEMVMTFMLFRALIVAAVAVGVVLLAALVVVLVKRAGRLDDAKRMAAPIARGLGERDGVWGAVGRGASTYLEKDARTKDRT